MHNEPRNIQNITHPAQVACPVTCEQVAMNSCRQLSVPGGQATWWRCPECGGWHVVVRENLETTTITRQMAFELAG